MQVLSTNLLATKINHISEVHSRNISNSIEKMSTGLRVNSAADDVGSIGIISKMRSIEKGIEASIRNVADAISMSRVGDDAIKNQISILQKVRELSVQAANGVLAPSDRQLISSQVIQLLEESNSISLNTNFNGHEILNAQPAEVGASISLSLPTEVTWTHHIVSDGAGGAKIINEDGNDPFDYSIGPTDYFYSHYNKDFLENINNNYPAITTMLGADSDDIVVVDRIPYCSSKGVDGLTTYDGTPSSYDNGYIAGASWASGAHDMFTVTGTIPISEIGKSFTVTYKSSSVYAHIENPAQDNVQIQTGFMEGDYQVFKFVNTTNSNIGVDSVDLSTATTSQGAISIISEALDYLNTQRAHFGQKNNSFSNTIDGLNSQKISNSNAKETISGTDYTSEISQLSSAQILSEAATAMLQQAQGIPKRLLSLLQ